MPPEAPDGGHQHLRWIGRFHLVLLPLGSLAWLCHSPRASLAFLAGGLGSLAFWHLHVSLVGRLLTPSLRRRWFYGLLTMFKLALLALYLRAMMGCFHTEVLSLATGALLFVAAIFAEAGRLIFVPRPKDLDAGN